MYRTRPNPLVIQFHPSVQRSDALRSATKRGGGQWGLPALVSVDPW
jgi:hypothetical protein